MCAAPRAESLTRTLPLSSHSSSPAAVLDAHVVSHTHWDREWYHPLERFRQRLVQLVDELVDRPPQPGESFLLDGQAVVLEDYLAVRPERQGELGALLAAGRLEAGPWYVLADELIPSGESLVRNLLAGRRVVRRLHGTPPPVLYCPDSFGHPAALPTVAVGFGLGLVVLWRGYGSARWPAGDTVRWAAPDGSEVALFHLPRSGYEFGSSLPADAGASRARWERMRAELAPRSTTGVVLLPNGADHHARQREHDAAVRELESSARETGDVAHASSLAAFADALLDRASHQRLPTVRGELRDSYGYTWTLPGTLATRAHEKRLNAVAERLLVREAEPFAALAHAAAPAAGRRALLHAAWRALLEAHPHDTLCGCSTDAVARAMELRLESAATQAIGIRDDAVLDVIGHDAERARDRRSDWSPVVVIRNPAARRRSGVAVIQIEEFMQDVPVGPGSAPAPTDRASDGAERPRRGRARAGMEPRGTLVQALRSWTEHRRTESPRDYPDNDLVRVTEAAVWVDDVGGYGTQALPLQASGARSADAAPSVELVSARGTRMTNGLIAVAVDANGAVSLRDNASGREVHDIFELSDQRDMGDLYTPSLRGPAVPARFQSARITRRGPLRGEMELRYGVPPLAAQSAGRHAPRGTRGSTRDISVRLVLTLDAGAACLRARMVVDNQRDDHRLRLGIRTDVASPAVHADAAFAVVEREPVSPSAAERAVEAAPPTAPMHRYVTLSNPSRGATVFSDGLAEYEATSDGRVLITLLRAVGDLSRNDLPERPGHAGWPTPTPGAQCHGSFEAEFAVMLHPNRDADVCDLVERAADDMLLPLSGFTLRSALAAEPVTFGLSLEGTGLAFSACKEAESGAGTILRCVNLTDARRSGTWRLGFTPARAWRARLDETPGEEIAAGSAIAFVAGPFEVVTILVR